MKSHRSVAKQTRADGSTVFNVSADEGVTAIIGENGIVNRSGSIRHAALFQPSYVRKTANVLVGFEMFPASVDRKNAASNRLPMQSDNDLCWIGIGATLTGNFAVGAFLMAFAC